MIPPDRLIPPDTSKLKSCVPKAALILFGCDLRSLVEIWALFGQTLPEAMRRGSSEDSGKLTTTTGNIVLWVQSHITCP